MSNEHYNSLFFEQLRAGAARSAEVIFPLVLEYLTVKSVVDVGCGDGTWLAVLQKLGVEDILGIDGEYISENLLQIPRNRFYSYDLTKKIVLDRKFDLAISLEVAEHLPPESANDFVDSLTRLAPAILFSAAIPLQGGNHHVNEQWPNKWAELFEQHSYLPVDMVRKRVWQNNDVEWWYAQNTLLFAHTDLIRDNAVLRTEFEQTNLSQLSLVHPRKYLEIAVPPSPPSGVKQASRLLFTCLRNAITKRVNSFARNGSN
jgi:SAM-dependent methyltransferase